MSRVVEAQSAPRWLLRAAPALAGAVLGLYFLSSWEIRPLFFSNQNTYFLQGLRWGGVEALQQDWVSGTRAPHVAFSFVVAALVRLGVLPVGVHALEMLLYVTLVWTFWTLSNSRHPGARGRSVSVRFLICAAFLVLLTERGRWTPVFNWGGLADQYVFGGYLQPSEFGIAILAAIGLLGSGRPRWAVVCLVVAAVFHASYLLPCAVVAGAVGADAASRKQWREAAVLLCMFGAGVAPIAAYGLTFRGDAAAVAEAHSLLAREIIPQHAWPAFWFSTVSTLKLVVMAAGALLAWRHLARPVAMAMSGSFLLIAGGIAFVYASDNAFVGLLFPWRGSVFLYPLSLFTLFVAMADTLAGLPVVTARARAASTLRACAVIVAAMLLLESSRELAIRRAPATPASRFANLVASSTGPQDTIIVPAVDADLWNRLRLITMRPIYVDGKNHPYLAAELLEWRRRNRAVEDLYRQPDSSRAARCRDLGATFYVSTRNAFSRTPAEDELMLVRCSG